MAGSGIPTGARVIEWTYDGKVTYVGYRRYRDGAWQVGGGVHATDDDLLTAIGHTPVTVLASFGPLTLAEVVGDALAFIAEHKEGGRLLGFRDGDAWLVYDSSAGGSLGRAALEHWGKYADLSSVVPLVPRQP